jgi:hypothetical protein
VIALWKKCGLTRSWNNPEKGIARKNSDKGGKFLIGQIDVVLMASIMIGYDGHRDNVNYIAVDSDLLGASYGKILIAEAEQLPLSAGVQRPIFASEPIMTRLSNFTGSLATRLNLFTFLVSV